MFITEWSSCWNVSTLDIMTPIIDLVYFEGKINNVIINLNSKSYNKDDIGFDIYISVLK